MAVETPRLARLRQVHGSAAVTYRRGAPLPVEGVLPEADIVISDVPGVALAVQTADCVPVIMIDRRLGVVAAVHAGWRGLVARAPVTAVERMARDFGTRAEDLLVAIGPAIGSCCYEVGPDVRTQFEGASFTPAQLGAWFSALPVASGLNPTMTSLSPVRAGRPLVLRCQSIGARRVDVGRSDRHADLRERPLHGKPSRRVLLVPARRRARRTDGGRDQALRLRLGRGLLVFRFVHGRIREAIGVGVQGAADVFVRHLADFVGEEARSGVQRLQPRVLHLVDAAHLLDEQQRVGAHVQRAVRRSPSPTPARRAGRDIRRRCWWRRQSTRGIPRRASRRRLRRARRSRRARDCRARRRRCRRLGVQGSRFGVQGSRTGRRRLRRGRRGDGHEVEDAVAAVALNDLFVAPDGVEHLRPQPHVANRADAVARFGDGDRRCAAARRARTWTGLAASVSGPRWFVRREGVRATPSTRRIRRPWFCGRRPPSSFPPRARPRPSSPRRGGRRPRASARALCPRRPSSRFARTRFPSGRRGIPRWS